MRICLIGLLFALVGFFCGCETEHYTDGRGDVGQFILQQVVSYGGRPTTTNGLPVVMSSWSHSKDDNGMEIRFSPSDYDRVEMFLNQAFAGMPQYGPKTSGDGITRIHEYRMSPKGGGVQLSSDDEGVRVVIIHTQTFPK
ncbi:MAG TPA: hypothetical protein VNZ25_02820 [Candidatus Angelobacter sp.]|jgi:hypothetical protein|nr:hypothetical protein [Candidatus Angelobacter sp.]